MPLSESAKHRPLIGSRRMWKTFASVLLRFGALYCLFGIFGIAWLVVHRYYPSPPRSE